MSNLEAKHYERAEMWKYYFDNPELDRRAMATIECIPEDSQRILDIGCGVGSITNRIKKPLVVGIDLARTPLREVKKNKLQGSISAIPVKACTFDTIVITEVLEHLPEELFNDAVNEIKRLAPRYILLSVPYEQYLEADYCKCKSCGNVFNVDHHYRSFKNDNIVGIFKNYRIIDIYYTGKCIRPNKFLLKLKHKLGIYYFTDRTICNKCGNALQAKKSVILKLLGKIFGLLYFMDGIIKFKIFNTTQPSHQIVLYKITGNKIA